MDQYTRLQSFEPQSSSSPNIKTCPAPEDCIYLLDHESTKYWQDSRPPFTRLSSTVPLKHITVLLVSHAAYWIEDLQDVLAAVATKIKFVTMLGG